MSELDYKIRLHGATGKGYAFAPIYPFVERRRAFPLKPTRRDWARHAIFFLLTAVTATFAGMLHAAFDLPAVAAAPDPLAHATHWFDYLRLMPASVAQFVGALVSDVLAHPQLFTQGLTFAFALLAVLLAHETGHYIACRRYRVNATLPYFIPAPPVFLAGTFGAFIKIKSPIPSRRALFDIGVAGPLAGFVVIVPVAILAALTAAPAPIFDAPAASNAGTTIILHDPLLMQIIWRIFRVDMEAMAFNPFYYAAWIGLLVTSLNLMPVGQLDGGHVVYSLLGARAHKWIGRAAFAVIATLSICGFMLHNSPSGFLYTVLLFAMLFVKHPYMQSETKALDAYRTVIALVTLLVFILAFLPFPITIV